MLRRATGWPGSISRIFGSTVRTALPVALVIGGAVGNLIDRVRAGTVTDFIQVYYRDWVFPSFNVADSAISVGATLLVLFGLFASGRPSGSELR